MLAIAGWLATWKLTGLCWPAYVGVALAPCWLMAEVAGTPLGGAARSPVAAFAAIAPPAATVVILRRARRSPDVDSSIHPFRILFGLLAASALLLIGLALTPRDLRDVPTWAGIAGGAVASLLWFAAAATIHGAKKPAMLARVRRDPAFLAFVLFGVAAIERSAGRALANDRLSWALAAARAVVLIGWVLQLVVVSGWFARAWELSGTRQRQLRVAREAVERNLAEHRRLIEQRRHDLRSLIAGIQTATVTLARYRAMLNAAEQRQLEVALLAEVDRLQHAISAKAHRHELFNLRVAIEPVIVAERARGACVTADVVDVEVSGSPDATAAIVQNLLVNSRTHAPGSAVGLVVRGAADRVVLRIEDDGGGLPGEVKARMASLVANPADPIPVQPDASGHGLGLAICVRLAHEQGARLELVDSACGTCFEISWPTVDPARPGRQRVGAGAAR